MLVCAPANKAVHNLMEYMLKLVPTKEFNSRIALMGGNGFPDHNPRKDNEVMTIEDNQATFRSIVKYDEGRHRQGGCAISDSQLITVGAEPKLGFLMWMRTPKKISGQ